MLRDLGRVAVAYSGGVDSAVVAKAAAVACGDGAVAVTAVSPSLAAGELATAKETAAAIGIRHRVVHTAEFADADYVKNAPDRCYFCKSTLYDRPRRTGGGPGRRRGGERGQRRRPRRPPPRDAGRRGAGRAESPAGTGVDQSRRPRPGPALGPAGVGQAGVPLSGQPDRLRHGGHAGPGSAGWTPRRAGCGPRFGLRTLRVRCLPDDSARVEVPRPALPRLIDDHAAVAGRLRELGFTAVAVDLEGFRSGSLNVVAGVGEG